MMKTTLLLFALVVAALTSAGQRELPVLDSLKAGQPEAAVAPIRGAGPLAAPRLQMAGGMSIVGCRLLPWGVSASFMIQGRVSLAHLDDLETSFTCYGQRWKDVLGTLDGTLDVQQCEETPEALTCAFTLIGESVHAGKPLQVVIDKKTQGVRITRTDRPQDAGAPRSR